MLKFSDKTKIFLDTNCVVSSIHVRGQSLLSWRSFMKRFLLAGIVLFAFGATAKAQYSDEEIAQYRFQQWRLSQMRFNGVSGMNPWNSQAPMHPYVATDQFGNSQIFYSRNPSSMQRNGYSVRAYIPRPSGPAKVPITGRAHR